MYYTGDEPSYLLSAHSFVHDRDFNLFNNFTNKDWTAIEFPDELKPQGLVAQKPGLIPSEHGTAFPFLISPIYALGGVSGVRFWLIGIAFASCLVCSGILDALNMSRIAGTIGGGVLALAPTWQLLASRVYPETTAALFLLLAVLLLARGHRDSSAFTPRWEAALTGLFIGLPPVLYLKYAPLSAGIGLLALAIPAIRRKPALWIGLLGAILLGLVNIGLFAEQGALGGNFGGSQFFQRSGFFYRFWYLFFDRFHGILPFEPILIFSLWAIPFYLLRVRERSSLILAGLGLALSFNLVMYGLWLSQPAWSVPGRYPAASLPLMAITSTAWLMRLDSLRPVRLVAASTLAAVSLSFYAVSFVQGTRLDLSLFFYRVHFPRFWVSWEDSGLGGVDPYNSVGYWMVGLILLTKATAYLWDLRRERRASAHLLEPATP